MSIENGAMRRRIQRGKKTLFYYSRMHCVDKKLIEPRHCYTNFSLQYNSNHHPPAPTTYFDSLFIDAAGNLNGHKIYGFTVFSVQCAILYVVSSLLWPQHPNGH